ncbi:putative gc-rich sequence DNA-binding factor [Schistosoma mansoni]|uniref:putative gc-rich sequence DNA-binding factor n=1 Tax=Schistosoma mansoni TaxID=6183 RepID=UPI0001A62AFE|nr:putative gc-rich sequence DNA-binding factor [Schistosoma mansoni]|eukprot:XP_018654479.1 putative gc-rich sequence DNA-binding factor [Schistosoma mansoni]
MHKTSLEEAKRDLERGKIVIADAREKLPNLAKQFMFYQEMKDYIDDLISCFNEKMSKIEYLEKRSIIIFRERYDKLVERRRMDMKDMADTVSQPTISSTCASRTPEEVKLFEARRKRCAERESRRIRRQRARELQNPNVIQVHVDGTSTDDEEPQATIVKRSADIDALLVDANALFEDVIEEFCELPLILERFIEWRNKYPESYQQAYISLCLPQLFSPIIRIQLIGWNPLNNHANPIEEMKWFQDLLDFCNLPLVDSNKNTKSTPLNSNKTDKSKNNNNENKNGSNHNTNNFDKTSGNLDDDLRIIPKSIEKIVLQRINELVSASWDPLSEKQSLQLVNLMRNLCSTYPTICIGSRPTEKLFTSIVKRIENTIQEDIFIPLYSKTLIQHRQGPAFIFFERQFNMGLKLLKNILLWINLLSMDTLKHISLTCLINRYLLIGLACLLSVVTLKSNEEKSNTPMNSPFPIGLSIDQSGSLAFRDAVQKLKISDPLSQIKRFLTQLLENIPPTRMYSDINVGQADIQIIERECMGTLLQLRDLLKN